MELIAINGSPRRDWNTGQLLEKVVEGAKAAGAGARLVHLADLQYTGCVSCFACKRIGGANYGRCAVRDDLTQLLDQCHRADSLVLGTPFYFGTESAFMRAFMERLWFQYFLYSNRKKPLAPTKKSSALIYTMNVPEAKMEEYGKTAIVQRTRQIMQFLFGPCELFLSCDTLQFADYSLYDTDLFDVEAKQKRNREVFPKELEAAFELGRRLAS